MQPENPQTYHAAPSCPIMVIVGTRRQVLGQIERVENGLSGVHTAQMSVMLPMEPTDIPFTRTSAKSSAAISMLPATGEPGR